MNESQVNIDGLVRANRLREAGLVLAASIPSERRQLRDELTAWLARVTEADTQRRVDDLSAEDYAKARAKLARQLLELRRLLDDGTAAAATSAPQASPSVFLSYNHTDAADARAVRDALRGGGIAVRMDADSMQPGAAIRDFIRRSIRATDATICIVSERSLLSGWVGQETALALATLDLWDERRFVACYLDTRFLDADFRLCATAIIDTRLAELESLFPLYAEQRIDTNDLNSEKSRLFELRNQLGSILQRLRDSQCLDLRPPARAASLKRLVCTIGDRGGGSR